MTRLGRITLIVWLLAGLLIVAYFISVMIPRSPKRAAHAPELGGQKVPEKVFDIRFDRPYDLFCSFYGQDTAPYRNCTILGFTGRVEESTQSARGIGLLSSSGSSSSYERHFDHWLVLRLADGRLAYIPPGAIKYIEEASAKDK